MEKAPPLNALGVLRDRVSLWAPGHSACHTPASKLFLSPSQGEPLSPGAPPAGGFHTGPGLPHRRGAIPMGQLRQVVSEGTEAQGGTHLITPAEVPAHTLCVPSKPTAAPQVPSPAT